MKGPPRPPSNLRTLQKYYWFKKKQNKAKSPKIKQKNLNLDTEQNCDEDQSFG